MSACTKISDENLTLLAFGEEAPPEAVSHLAQCDECQARLKEVRCVRAAAAVLLPVAPPDRTIRALRLEAEKVARRRRRRLPAAWWWLPTAAVAALLLLVVGVHHPAEPPPAEPRFAGIAPLNLAGLETDLDRRLGEIGISDDEAIADDDYDAAGISDPETDLETAAVAPADDDLLLPSTWEDEEESLDQLEVALVHLESDLGLEPSGSDPAKGE